MFIGLGMGMLILAAALVLIAAEDSIVFFYSPTEVVERTPQPRQRIRIGGLVEEGSVEKADGGTVVNFRVPDIENTVAVTYRGLLPDLFREGQGVVAEGTMDGGLFHADEVLAKHDENYMPPEVSDSLKESGHWEEIEEALKDSGQMTKGGAQ